jgi:hypothetical protein
MLRSAVIRSWEAQPQLQLPHTLRVLGETVELENPNAKMIYRWPAFLYFRETPNLFILQKESSVFT